MSNYVKNIRVRGLYNRFNIEQDFYPGVNVLYGINGGCKTTLLHVLANALNGDYERFAFLTFRDIIIQFDDGSDLRLTRQLEISEFGEPNDFLVTIELNGSVVLDRISVNEIESYEAPLLISRDREIRESFKLSELNKVLPTAYIPAFRSIIDAWKSSQRVEYFGASEEVISAQAILFIRRWLLPFIPRVDYPSLIEIEQALVKKDFESGYIEKYLQSLNSYLDRKRVVINKDSQDLAVELVYEDGMRSKGLGALSSGERQIAILFYVTSHISSDKVILIDEPEISLHVDWQRLLMKEIAKQSEYKQIIACTHSPIIGADEENRMELNLTSFSARDYELNDL